MVLRFLLFRADSCIFFFNVKLIYFLNFAMLDFYAFRFQQSDSMMLIG